MRKSFMEMFRRLGLVTRIPLEGGTRTVSKEEKHVHGLRNLGG
jgi:hypothetical protein